MAHALLKTSLRSLYSLGMHMVAMGSGLYTKSRQIWKMDGSFHAVSIVLSSPGTIGKIPYFSMKSLGHGPVATEIPR